MSQERTEQPGYWKERFENLLFKAGQERNQDKAEIDRLNAKNADKDAQIEKLKTAFHNVALEKVETETILTAKVEDRDAEIIRQRERADRLDSELHKQNCRNQDQAEEIDRINAENESLRQTLARYFSDAKTVEEYERTEDELRAELDAAAEEIEDLKSESCDAEYRRALVAKERDDKTKEIERLRAALEEAESDINELLVNSESPTFIEQYAPQAKAEIRAALKGEE